MLGKALQTAAAGNAAGEVLGVEDVFSTFLYTGNGSTQTITNGIDLAGEGGAVWIKSRSGNKDHVFVDNNNVGSGFLRVNTNGGLLSSSTAVNLFNSDGFRIGNNANVNFSGDTLVSWTFRKAPKFFDIVTYTGNGTPGRTLSHNLQGNIGAVIIKRTDDVGSWYVAARVSSTQYTVGDSSTPLRLNSTSEGPSIYSISGYWTNTTFRLNAFWDETNSVNISGATYVAYLFAHDAGGFGDDGNQNVISCGSVTTNGSGQIPDVNLGWEPQWLIMKNITTAGSWDIYDTQRGWISKDTSQFNRLEANSSISETPNQEGPAVITSTGFRSNTLNWTSGQTYIYIAIRRGLMKTPTDATKVFGNTAASNEPSTSSSGPTLNSQSGVLADLVLHRPRRASVDSFYVASRLQGKDIYLRTDLNSGEADAAGIFGGFWKFDNNEYAYIPGPGFYNNTTSGTPYVVNSFRRAPGFFDVVAYTGTGSARTVAHNLGVAPELIIVKKRTGTTATGWMVYSSALGATKRLEINTTGASVTDSGDWNDTAPTSSVFTVNFNQGTNNSTSTYIAYLFATVPGVSKVGSYTGTGTTLNVDCGFTSGARFVLIKRTDSTGDWYVWDTARGIVAANDPYLLLNSNAAENTSTDYIDPLSSGFQISSTAPAAINANGGSFVFLAIS